jgi:hypothetical protein
VVSRKSFGNQTLRLKLVPFVPDTVAQDGGAEFNSLSPRRDPPTGPESFDLRREMNGVGCADARPLRTHSGQQASSDTPTRGAQPCALTQTASVALGGSKSNVRLFHCPASRSRPIDFPCISW